MLLICSYCLEILHLYSSLIRRKYRGIPLSGGAEFRSWGGGRGKRQLISEGEWIIPQPKFSTCGPIDKFVYILTINGDEDHLCIKSSQNCTQSAPKFHPKLNPKKDPFAPPEKNPPSSALKIVIPLRVHQDSFSSTFFWKTDNSHQIRIKYRNAKNFCL